MKPTAELSRLIEESLHKITFEGRSPSLLYDPMRYLLRMGGKRIRPLILLMSYQAFTDAPIERAMPYALATEVFHNFTLAHDDIMDHAPERRGMPTLHVQWDTNTAILAGDALFAYCFGLLKNQTNDPYFSKVFSLFYEVIMGVCEGQMSDLQQASQSALEVSIPDYLEMIRKKTAVLIGGAMAMGAAAGGAESNNIQMIDRFGQAIGMAFQLRDDYLDLYADAEKFGKQTGGDIYENKKNFLFLKALEKATPAQKQELIYWFETEEKHPDKLNAVRRIYDHLRVGSETEKIIEAYYLEAIQSIDPIADVPGIRRILDFLQSLMKREH